MLGSKSRKYRKARHSMLCLCRASGITVGSTKSMLKVIASRERGVRFKQFKQQLFLHLHLREVAPAMFRRILVAQTILHQPGPWHEQVRSEVIVKYHQRGLVVHCQAIVLNGVCSDVSPRVDVHEMSFAEFCIHCIPCRPKKRILTSVPR